jgi:hypothetical protein
MLLPYLEQNTAFAAYNLTRPPGDPANLPITGRALPVYTCPSMALPRVVPDPCGETLGPGSYLISSRVRYMPQFALDGAFATPPEAGKRYELGFDRIVDGSSHTLLVGETDYDWADYLWTNHTLGPCHGNSGSCWGDFKWAEGYWHFAFGHTGFSIGQATRFNFNDPSQAWDGRYRTTFRSDHPGGVQFVLVDGSV